jgi:protein-L-isoaspartate(D-aspartate) O-methyltransferase
MNIDFARQQMIQQQIRAWDVLDDDVLDVFETVHRELFVPAGFADLAFAETEIPIGHGESMLTPVIEGRILQALALSPTDAVLEIGTGTGFLTACLARLTETVVSIDIHEDFVDRARRNLDAASIGNANLELMDGTRELPAGSFDAVVVGGSIERFDTRYVHALNPGGRLFVVVGSAPTMEARLVTRSTEADWTSEVLFETVLKPLENGTLPPEFLF